MYGVNGDFWVEFVGGLFSYNGFRPLDVLLREKELSVQIGQVDSIQINLRDNRMSILPSSGVALLTISMFLKPAVTTFFSNSQPMPPAPTSKILLDSNAPNNSAPRMRFA